MKLGNRVTVVQLPKDHPLHACSGKRGEVVQIDDKAVQGEGLATCPGKGLVLVDAQFVNGARVGHSTMREWFRPEELEVG